MSDGTSILLVDDHAMFRAGIKALLEAEGRLQVVGEASSGDEAVDRVRELKPDVVIMDLSMPGSNGLEATRRIAALELDTKVLVLTVHAEEEYLVPVVEAGASGYLTKTSADNDLIEAIKVVARGEVYLPPKATTLLLQRYKASESEEGASLHDLSTREQEVLALTAAGGSVAAVAGRLQLSAATIKTHLHHSYEKLDVSDRAAAVATAIRFGLID